MSQRLAFHRLFGHVLSRQVEYSYGSEEQSFTAMVPLGYELLPKAMELAALLDFGGEWTWAVQRFSETVRPDTFLLRLAELSQFAGFERAKCFGMSEGY